MSFLKYKFGVVLGLLLVIGHLASSQWQEYPINCFTCDGAECASSVGLLNVCPGGTSSPQTCVTVFGSEPDSSVIRRGCSEDVYTNNSDYCDSNTDKCLSCSSNGCNTAMALSEYVQCLSCDSKTDADCVRNPAAIASTKLCLKSCMVALYARNVTDPNPTYELSRSCLDDKDLDDREICSDGGDAFCVACEGEKCNLAKLPDKRFTCYNCDENSDCAEPTSEECASHTAADQCYFLFDGLKDIIGMGCRSEFEEDALLTQIKNKQLLLCDGEECNYFNNLPEQKLCNACDSETNENCAIDPATIENSVTCNIPYSQCYTKVSDINGGTTVRGCLSNLSGDDFYECLQNGNKNCQSCSGALCNEEIVPSDRAKCQRCSSTEDNDCERNPSALSVCPLYTHNDTCVSAYNKGVTTRGCGSELTCDSNNKKSCQICSSEGCNQNNVKKSSENSYGIFQNLPLNCYTCSGDECEQSTGLIQKCEGNDFQDCLTVFSNEGKVLSRGCEDIIETDYYSHCITNPELCFNCKSNGCNTISVATDYVNCVYCNTEKDPDCVRNISAIETQSKCTKGCVTALYPRSSDANIFELVRTCLDDIESDDVENCGKDSKCVKCEESKCNVQKLPETRLSCNACDGDDCEFPVAKDCSSFSETDQCFMLFDETLSVARMGCKSELTESEIRTSIKQLFLCNGDNCNNYESLPEANICAVCNSTSDALCATSPGAITSSTSCQAFPHTSCFSKVDKDGSTVRGCLVSLEIDDFIECLEGDSANCQTCVGSTCNKEIFPANRTKCHRCSSSSNADCESQPTASEVCPIYVEDDSCVTKLIAGITNRDCGSELDCGDLGRKNCRTCSGIDCNTVDLIGESIGDPGLWQAVPINCYTCDGEECATSNGLLQSCINNQLQTCATVFGQDGEVIARGCIDLVEASHSYYCDANPDDCFECKSSGCNLATSKADYIDCIFCDARTNPNCTFNVADISRTRKCHKACMTALYPRTSEADASYDLTRTCLDDKDLDDRDSCASDPLCSSCLGSACNTQLVPEVRKSCNHCSGESCELPTFKTCSSYTSQEQCFILFDEVNSVIEMGCKSDYNPSDIRSLLVLKKLFLCDEDNCNVFENLPQTRSCRLCNSLTDKFCATDPPNVSSSTTCNQLPNTDCYTRILNDGHTERGCLSSLDGDQFLNCYSNSTSDCTICADGLCNDELFPAERLACHTCNSAESSSCDANPNHANVCLKYSPDQTCIVAISKGNTYRGCSTELTCDSSDSTTCRSCNTTNCNVINLKRHNDANPGFWQSLPLNCYICSDDDCKVSLNRLNVCDNNINQHCMTVFGEDGTVVRRGCSDDVELEYSEYCDVTAGKCFNCNSNGCNSAFALSDYVDCIHCDSRLDQNCVLDVAAVSATRQCNTACMVALYPRSVNESSIYELSRSCLDDKDLDDRELCGSDQSLCKSCLSGECNVDDAIDDRFECYSCVGESCESPVSGQCIAYKEDDTCFILFDEQNSVQQMGCTSQLDPEELEDSLDNLFTCSEKNCNDFSNIPQPQFCSSCDSSSDVQCATSPKGVATVTKCSSLPNVECYTRVKSDGKTARGCVSDLTKALRQECLSSNDTTCSSCKGDGCNLEIFPEDRLRCHKCNSLDDPTCEYEPNATYVCPDYLEDEVCSSKLVNDVTYRGCGGNFLCDDSDKQYCKMCNWTDCNRANLYQNNIGYPGKWQGLPINCFTCFGEECDDSSTTLLRKCENNNLQNCVTVFNMAGKAVQRGCSDTIYEGYYDHHCDNHPDLCTYCKSSGCNNADSIDDYVDCLFCDSTTNPNCTSQVTNVSRTRKCQKKCMTALYPRSDDTDPAYELSRSCLDDKELDDRDECESGNAQYCKICEGDNCNRDLIPEKRLSCYRCSGEECETANEAECPAYRDNDRCFLLFDDSNSIAQMGCRSDLNNSTLTALHKKLLFCDGDNCNDYSKIPTPRKCLVCDSANDTLCATRPDSLIDFKQCNNFPYTMCYTRIENGLTKRGCMSDVEADTIDECIESGDNAKCNVCDAEYCNIGIYPVDRRSCHRCSSKDDANCQSNPNDPDVCPFYQENDECVVEISGETTNRGCISEFTCNAEDRSTCRICPADNCNYVDLLSNYVGQPGQWQDLPLSCYKCEGTDCQTSLGLVSKCDGNNIQNCITVFDNAGAVIERGCSDDILQTHEEYCDTNGGRCQSCKSSSCNNVLSLDDYVDCIFCDSATNPNCVLNPDEGLRTRKCHKQCMVALFPRSSEDDPSFELSRSCLDDKDLEDRETCTAGSDQKCQACVGASCNRFAFPEERHKCWTCRGSECEDPKIQDCISYHAADQCYILFDNVSSVIAMGCRSEYEQAAVPGLIQTKSLLLCDGENCNSFETIPNPQPCVVCNSATDARCATNPNLIVNATTCSSLPYTGCYTRINENGDTVRGCQSALPSTEFYGCHTESDSACSTCPGNKCNADVFPENRLRCHRCNSTDDASCAESPTSNGVCPKLTDGESCVAAYKDGITIRGCSSELSCDESNRKTCRVCAGSACNIQNLEHIAKDGEPGRWQDLPISCYTCEGAACTDSLGSVQTCSNNNDQNCMTVFNADGVVIQRGCSDSVTDVQEDWCEKNLDKCYRCNSNECNRAISLDEYVECISCDTSSDKSCIKNPISLTRTRKCYQSCMTALFPRSTEDNPSYETARTCLDDKDLDDRVTCEAGSEHLCSACNGAKCNVDDLPTDRRSCFHCSGDGCQLPSEELCSGYRTDDECFIMLDEQQTIVEMGCRSDFTIDQSISLVKAKRLFLCDGDNCNSFEALPASQSCALCNSRTDVNCAVNPADVGTTTSCQLLPYTNCYSRVLNDGATERGCLSSLMDNDFYDCLIGNSTSCTTCTGGSCNKQVYPANRISCHICDSTTDANCETSPNTLSICPKYEENESCVTSFIAGTTSRGCGTALECDGSNRRNCRVCTSPGCNSVDLASKQDDNFGKWQDLPLACYHCEGTDCQKELGTATKCQNNNEQDCLVVFNSDGDVIRRGCSDEVEEEFEEYCDTNTGLCLNCKSNECNTATALSDFTDCVYCDSNKNTTCVTNVLTSTFKTRKCQGGCMVALYPSDSSSDPAYDLTRTCLNDKDSNDQKTCSTGDEPFCKSCTGASCNTEDLPDDRLRCHSCLGESCEQPISEQCPLYKEGDQCFVRFDNTSSVTEMGCLSAYRGQDILDILKTKQVYICKGDNCNSLDALPTAQRCAICDSANDVNCATNPLLVGSVGTCSLLPYTNCYTKITETGTTIRGCLRDLDADQFAQCILAGGDSCIECVGDGCNRQIFPESRLRCYSCSSDTDPNCESLPITTTVCPYIRDSEKCVTALGGNLTERGCSSQLLCDTTDKSTCRHCSLTSCNTLDLINRVDDNNHGKWQELPLRCHSCSGEHCLNSLGPALTCKDGDQQDCMTVFGLDGEVVQRGCLYDVEAERDLYCRANPDRCLICKSNECNDAWELNDYVDCVYCNSETDATCVTNPSKSDFPNIKCQKACMAAAFTASNGTTQVIRTCLDDKEVQVQHLCSSDETGKVCSSCTDKSCNNFNYPTDRLTCQVCQGTDCSTTVAEHCAAYAEGDTCFAKYENGKVDYAGCTSAIESTVIESWKEQNILYTCEGDSCNSLDKVPSSQNCVACDSSKNVECATNPSAATGSQFCSAPVSSCFSNITNGVTHRGCLQSLSLNQQTVCEQTGGSTLCETCSGEKCNSEVYPTDRRQCHICKSDSDNKCKADPTALLICPNYTANNQCVVKLTNGLTERGCSSDLACDVVDNDHCRICNTDGCNTVQLDNGAHTIIANNLLLKLLVTIVGLIAMKSKFI